MSILPKRKTFNLTNFKCNLNSTKFYVINIKIWQIDYFYKMVDDQQDISFCFLGSKQTGKSKLLQK